MSVWCKGDGYATYRTAVSPIALRNVGARPVKITGFCRPLISAGDVSKKRRIRDRRDAAGIAWCRALIASRRATLAGNLITDIRGRRFSLFPLSLSSVSPQLSGETRSISDHAMYLGNNRVSRCTPSSSVIIVSNRRVSGSRTHATRSKSPLILNIPNQFPFNLGASLLRRNKGNWSYERGKIY